MEQNLKEIVTDEMSIERVTNIKYLGGSNRRKIQLEYTRKLSVRFAR